jgi:hypothetical protein
MTSFHCLPPGEDSYRRCKHKGKCLTDQFNIQDGFFRFVSFRFLSPSLFYLPVHSRCRGFSLDHTQTHTTVGRTPLDEGSARRRDLYLTTQTLYKRQISTPPVGFEPTIPASARPQTHALDRATTGIGQDRLSWN